MEQKKCSNQRCIHAFLLSKDLCPKCSKSIGDSKKQVIFCKVCNVIYSIRPKLTKDEEDVVEGLCIMCKNELKKREKE